MKAIVFKSHGGSDQLELVTDVEKPQPNDDQVLIRVHAVGVNPVDTYIRDGQFGPMPLPHIPGMDAAGVVEAVGVAVTSCKPGDRVWTFHKQFNGQGTYAEYVVVAQADARKLHESLSFEQGAALGIPYLTAEHALVDSVRAKPGEVCLIHGASGGVGVAAVQIAKGLGLVVIGTAGTDEGCADVRTNGAHFVFNHSAEGYSQKMKDTLAENGHAGVDVVLEMLADKNLSVDMDIVREGGRITVIGCRGDQVTINPGLFIFKGVSVSGTRVLMVEQDVLKHYAAHMYAGVEQGWLKPLVGKKLKLSEARLAHDEIMRWKAKGKMVLIPDELIGDS